MYYEIRHKRRVESFKSFIDSLPYRNHDYLKNGIEKLSIREIDDLELLILS